MVARLVFFLTAIVTATPATVRRPANRWLVIAGSANTLTAALNLQQALQPAWPAAQIIASSDCDNLRGGLYIVAAAVLPDQEAAVASARKLQARVAGAYPRTCTVKPGSRIALGIPLIDASIYKAPRSVASWTDRDRISEIVRLANDAYLWIRRGFASAAYDPQEGREVSVLSVSQSSADARVLEAHCTEFSYAAQGSRVAITCAREVSDGISFHTVDVFDIVTGRKISSTPRCRKPRFISSKELGCEEERAGANGLITVRPRRVSL